MRERFDAQLRIGSIPISEIKIPTKSRDEFPPFLRAVQEIYNNSELSAEIFDLVEMAVCKKDNVTLLDDDTLKGLNDVIVKMGHSFFLKKRRINYLSKPIAMF